MSMLGGMQSDTTKILADWAESISVERYTTSYSSTGASTKTWVEVDTGDVDIQPKSGKSISEIEELKLVSTHVIEAEYDLNVLKYDRIVKGSDIYNVDHIKNHEDHLTIFATKTGA